MIGYVIVFLTAFAACAYTAQTVCKWADEANSLRAVKRSLGLR